MSTDREATWRKALLWSVIASMKMGIINDIHVGIVDATDIKCFADLHMYVDANEYGGFRINEFVDPLIELFGGRDEGIPQAYIDFMNEAQGVIDEWLRGKTKASKIITPC